MYLTVDESYVADLANQSRNCNALRLSLASVEVSTIDFDSQPTASQLFQPGKNITLTSILQVNYKTQFYT